MPSTNPQPQTSSRKGDIKKFKRTVEVHAGTEIDPKTQSELNAPLADEKSRLSKEDKEFLENLIHKVNSKEIDLLRPSSILNQEVYNKLDGKHKSRAEQFVSATLFTLRQIVDYYNNPHSNDSYQMGSLLSNLRRQIETLEKEIGDVLKI